MYPADITWKDNSGESASEDNPDSNGSMPGVDELFKSRIMFNNTGISSRSLKRNLNGSYGMGMITAVRPNDSKIYNTILHSVLTVLMSVMIKRY